MISKLVRQILFALIVCFLCSPVHADVFTSRDVFMGAITGATVRTYENIASPNGFVNYGSAGVTIDGVNVVGSHTRGAVTSYVTSIIDSGYASGFFSVDGTDALRAGYAWDTTTQDYIGRAVFRPLFATTALGMDLALAGHDGRAAAVNYVAVLSDGQTSTGQLTTDSEFLGLTSDLAITSLIFEFRETTTMGAHVIFDNVTTGNALAAYGDPVGPSVSTPEPSAILLLGTMVGGMAVLYRRRMRVG